jgi:hypothetical protein
MNIISLDKEEQEGMVNVSQKKINVLEESCWSVINRFRTMRALGGNDVDQQSPP